MKTTLRFLLLGSTVAIILAGESATGRNAALNKTCFSTTLQYLRLKLAKDAINTEDIVIRFKSTASEKYVYDEDAPYLEGFGAVHLYSFSSDSIPLAINVLPLPNKKSEVIRLNVMASSDGIFTLNMNTISNIPALYDIWLIDKYQNDSLDMRKYPVYSFNISHQDTMTWGANRFALIIRQDTAYQYRLLNFTAIKNSDTRQVQVGWSTKNEGNNTEFTVERSVCGQAFTTLDSMSSTAAGSYTYIDKAPSPGPNLYRLKQVDTDQIVAYSNTLEIIFPYPGKSGNNVNIYPNPTVNNTINLSTIAPPGGNNGYHIEFMDGSGRVVKEVLSGQLPWQGNITGLQPGTYFVRVLNSSSQTLVGETRFVKL